MLDLRLEPLGQRETEVRLLELWHERIFRGLLSSLAAHLDLAVSLGPEPYQPAGAGACALPAARPAAR